MQISNDYTKIKELLDYELGYGITFDIVCKETTLFNRKMSFYFMSGLADNFQIYTILSSLHNIPKHMNINYSKELIIEELAHGNNKFVSEYEEIRNSILTGLSALIIEGEDQAIVFDTRNYPTRSIAEPDMEKVIRGSHDGFTESIAVNIALLRRRTKDGSLRNEIIDVGIKAPLNVCLSYIDGVCDKKILEHIRSQLKKVKTDHLIMADKELEELILHQKFNPYPLVRYTERPDTVAVHLYQGMFAIFVDTSPSVILAPATLLDHLQHTEEYRQNPISGTYLKLLRFIGIFGALFITPLWYLMIQYNYFPGILKFLIPKDIGISVIIQILTAEIGIELLRMASIHTPTALSTAMGLVAAVLIGDIAINVGVFTEHVVLLVAISAIGTYVTPSYELGLANKVIKIVFLVLIWLFGLYGLISGLVLWIIMLASLKSFNKPYLYPIIPFNLKMLIKAIIRLPYQNKKSGKE